jgi:hypothetical protein
MAVFQFCKLAQPLQYRRVMVTPNGRFYFLHHVLTPCRRLCAVDTAACTKVGRMRIVIGPRLIARRTIHPPGKRSQPLAGMRKFAISGDEAIVNGSAGRGRTHWAEPTADLPVSGTESKHAALLESATERPWGSVRVSSPASIACGATGSGSEPLPSSDQGLLLEHGDHRRYAPARWSVML